MCAQRVGMLPHIHVSLLQVIVEKTSILKICSLPLHSSFQDGLKLNVKAEKKAQHHTLPTHPYNIL